jgi:type IV pilus assembly protein PilC
MPVFIWEGTAASGEVRKGKMEGASRDAVQARLRQMRIAPSVVRAEGLLDRAGNLTAGLTGGVTTRDLTIFTRQFSTMIDAGLPLVQALNILASQTESRKFGQVLGRVKEDVESGSTFADALRKHPTVFDELYCNMVAAGETAGLLDTIMQRLAVYIEKADKLKREVKSAMTYPVAVISVAVVIVSFLLWKVIPTFAKMFEESGQALPAPTQFVIDLSNGFVNNLFTITIAGVGAVFGFIAFRRSPTGRSVTDKIALSLPVFGLILRKVAIARFARTLSTMISSGVPLLDGLLIVARTAGNTVIERGVMYSREKISEGRNLADPLGETKLFPAMVVQMIGVGEAAGALDTMLSKVADFYEDEVDVAVASMKALLEPMIMVFLGVMLGGLVIAMYLPIFNMAGAMQGTASQ